MSNLTLSILIIILFVIVLTILIVVLTIYKTVISFGEKYHEHANKVLNLCKKMNDNDKSIIETNTTLLGFISNDLTFIRQYMIRRKNPIKIND